MRKGSNFQLKAPGGLMFGLGGGLRADWERFRREILGGKTGLGEFEQVVGSTGQGPLGLHSFEAAAEELA